VSSCVACHYLKLYPTCLFVYPTCLLKARMSGEPNELEKSVEEVLRKLMADRPVSEGIQASSTRGLQASPSTGRRSTRINPVTEQRSKHRGDLANAKQIPSILPEYIPPLADMLTTTVSLMILSTLCSLRTFRKEFA
jgi:hypothetical protein